MIQDGDDAPARMGRSGNALRLFVCGAATLGVVAWLSWPRQEGDPSFDATVARPAYAAARPSVLVDEGHRNVHTTTGRYEPFARLLRADGYDVSPSRVRLTRGALDGHAVLVIANALGWRGAGQLILDGQHLEGKLDLRADAFDGAECDAVRGWVESGGSLLLVADHAPCGQAAAGLAGRFGVGMTDWYAEDPEHHDEESGNWGWLVFSRDDDLLGSHPILEGRDASERICRVLTFTGQSLVPPPAAVSLLRMSRTAIEYPWRDSPDDCNRPAAGLSQGLALELGKGRVVVIGEAALLSSQIVSSPGRTARIGMSHEGCDDRQLLLNVMHWLSHLI
ncbi:MAG: DUF4350 domain-containing protein [Acidobacteriota bacterium]